jgi:hypothetical protein
MKKIILNLVALINLLKISTLAQSLPCLDEIADFIKSEDQNYKILKAYTLNHDDLLEKIIVERLDIYKIPRRKEGGMANVKLILFNELPHDDDPRMLVRLIPVALSSQKYPRENWGSDCLEKNCRFLLFVRLNESPPYDNQKLPYFFDFPSFECGSFQIQDDPLDNRLGVDLELLYEDLQLIISHRPDWPSVPAGQLKTDFAKAVLARLLEQTAQPEQSNSEPSEVGRQAAE